MMDAHAQLPEDGRVFYRHSGARSDANMKLLRVSTLNVRCLGTTVSEVLTLAIVARLDILAVQEVNTAFGATGYVKRLCAVNGFAIHWGQPVMGKVLVATLVRQGTSVHPLQHVTGCASPARIQHFAVDRHNLQNLVFTNLYGHALNDVARDRAIADAHAGTFFFQRDFFMVGDYNCGDKEGQLGWLLANFSGQLAHVESRYGTSRIPTTRLGTKRIDHALCNNDFVLVDHMQFVGPRDHDLANYSCVNGQQPCRYVRPSLRMWAETAGNVDDLIDELAAMSDHFDSALFDGDFDEAWRLLSNAAENHLCVHHGLRRTADWRPVHQERDNKHRGVKGVKRPVVFRRLLKLVRMAKHLTVDPDNKRLRSRAVATLNALSDRFDKLDEVCGIFHRGADHRIGRHC